jgi:hypothetical protein
VAIVRWIGSGTLVRTEEETLGERCYYVAALFAVELGEPHCGGCAHGRFRNLK